MGMIRSFAGGAVLAASMLLAGGGAEVEAEQYRMNHLMLPTAVGSIVDQWFADEIRSRTKGEVSIEIYFSSALGEPKETLALLETGAIEMAAMSPAYFPDQLPFFAAPNSIPMALNGPEQSYELTRRILAEVPALMEEAKAKGIRPLYFHVLNPYLMVAKEPILDLGQLNGKKFRTWGSDLPRAVEVVGATPVTLVTNEIYEGLLRGNVDIIPFSVDLIVNYKIYEVATHVMETAIWCGSSWGIWITDAAWAKISPENQQIILEVAAEAAARDLAAIQQAAVDARAELLSKGVTFHPFPSEETAKWRSMLPDFFSEFIARAEERGKGDDARKMVEIWKQVAGS